MQRLIVEGKGDAIVVATIVEKEKKLPKGYANKGKLKREFIKIADGDSQIKIAFNEQLDTPDVERIGVIIDADNKGATARLASLIDFIQEKTGADLSDVQLTPKGAVFQLPDERFIGIWVMPNNKNEGYLENFVSLMIPETDKTWQFAQAKVQELSEKDFCKFTEAKKQKALVHTFLAWQKKPGVPMGTAVSAGFLSTKNSLVENFVDWFKNTFTLEQ